MWSRIINAETLLASLEALGVDNARIEIEAKEDGSKPLEVPCPDGSAAVVSDFVKFAGTRYAPSKDGVEHVAKTRIVPSKASLHCTSTYMHLNMCWAHSHSFIIPRTGLPRVQRCQIWPPTLRSRFVRESN